MNKRLIIIISAAVVLLSIVGVFFGIAVSKQKKTQTPVATVQIKKVLDELVISPVASLDSKAIWYFNTEGRLFRTNKDGSGISEFPLPALATSPIRQVLWPKTGSDFIVITNSGTSASKSYYNSAAKLYINLPKNIQSIDWMPDSLRVVYVWQSGDNKTQQLVIANADGTGFKAIKDVFWPDLNVKVSPDGKTALLWRNAASDLNKIYSANLNTGEINTVVDLGKNLGAVWVSANKFIFAQSSITPYPKIYLYDFISKQVVDLSLNTTLDKIAIDSNGQTLYAAVPKKDNTGDTFIKEDLISFKQTSYFEPVSNVSGTHLLLVGADLYFTNSLDQKFYTISK